MGYICSAKILFLVKATKAKNRAYDYGSSQLMTWDKDLRQKNILRLPLVYLIWDWEPHTHLLDFSAPYHRGHTNKLSVNRFFSWLISIHFQLHKMPKSDKLHYRTLHNFSLTLLVIRLSLGSRGEVFSYTFIRLAFHRSSLDCHLIGHLIMYMPNTRSTCMDDLIYTKKLQQKALWPRQSQHCLIWEYHRLGIRMIDAGNWQRTSEARHLIILIICHLSQHLFWELLRLRQI